MEDVSSDVRQRAPPKCSLCSSLEHNARTCPERQRNVWYIYFIMTGVVIVEIYALFGGDTWWGGPQAHKLPYR